MVYYDHGLVGATLAVAAGAQRRYGWPAVVLAALAAMFPDWDAAPKHVSLQAYQQGHRVWGHNLFAVTLAGAALGGLGYLIHQSRSHRLAPKPTVDPGGAAPWVVLGIAVLWSHPLLDLLYCGWGRDADWPVRLLWPVVPGGFARPWMPWTDWGATALLLGGLLVCILARHHRQRCAIASLVIMGLYVGVRGALLQGG
jgi:inner membrane protein